MARLAARFADNAVRGLLELLGADEAGGDFERLVDRNCKADALRSHARGHVDADYQAVNVQERSAGIARIDARIALNQVVVFLLVADLHVAMQRADDPARHRMLISVGIADGDDLLTFHQIAGGAELDHRQWLFDVDLDHGQVGLAVVSDASRDGCLSVGQRHLNVADPLDDVIVRQHIAARIDHNSRAHAVDLADGGRCAE